MLICCWSSNDVVDQLMMNKLERPHFISLLAISVLILRIIMLITLIIILQPVMAARNDTLLERLISRTYSAFLTMNTNSIPNMNKILINAKAHVLYFIYFLYYIYIYIYIYIIYYNIYIYCNCYTLIWIIAYKNFSKAEKTKYYKWKSCQM